MTKLDQNYWQSRWLEGQTGWDIGFASTPLVDYCNQLNDKSVKILIPGCGNGYEAEYLFEQGFENTFLIDISPRAIDLFQNRVPRFPKSQLICGDFFRHIGKYDLILEQTFFCALDPSSRKDYVSKCSELLDDNGSLVGLLFDGIFDKPGPPFGGTKEEYLGLFSPHFKIKTLSVAHNSIEPRAGREWFINFKKK